MLCFLGSAEPLYTFTIVTTDSSKQLSFLHDRMPVVLTSEDDIELWLSESDWSMELAHLVKPCEEITFDWCGGLHDTSWKVTLIISFAATPSQQKLERWDPKTLHSFAPSRREKMGLRQCSNAKQLRHHHRNLIPLRNRPRNLRVQSRLLRHNQTVDQHHLKKQ